MQKNPQRGRRLLRWCRWRRSVWRDGDTRVCFLDHTALLSGGELALLRLIPALNIQPLLILAEDGPLAAEMKRQGVEVHVLPLATRTLTLRRNRVLRLSVSTIADTVRYIVIVARFIRQRDDVDIIHTNSMKAHVYGSLVAVLARKPLVWHMRDRVTRDYLGALPALFIKALSRIFPDAVIANSEATLKTLRIRGKRVLHLPDGHVIPSPVHISSTSGTAAVVREEIRCIGMVGRLTPWKGQDLFLRAAAQATGSDVKLRIVGSAMFGEEEYARELVDLAKSLGIDDRVDFRGFQRDVMSELQEMDVLVHASIIPEPFGQVVVEGMAAGVPVIAAAAGGPAEMIVHDTNGLLFDPGNESDLVAAMRYATDGGVRERLVAGGYGTAGDMTPDRIAPRVESVYRAVLGSS